ncbi:MAG TPA: hydroxymethylbilane synthase [Dehalococcoidia bacterium]|nr:hydroxymethylbilane synthase [Dehalococcoidia bacterium]
MAGRTFRVGTRGSRLALAQTELALAALRSVRPDISFQVTVVRTRGDRDQHTPLSRLGGRGVFVAELEQALLRGEVDIAVHSLKDLPSRPAPGLVIAAVPLRDDPRDCLVSRQGLTLDSLPPGAAVGTGSPRRAAQLRALRPDLTVAEIRGNVDTRVRKVMEGEYDAAVLALAGLRRLGLADSSVHPLEPETMLPAPGQGAIALEVRGDDAEALALCRAVDDPVVHACVTAERAFEAQFGGGCSAVVAALAVAQGETIWLRGLAAAAEGMAFFRGEARGPLAEAEAVGRGLAHELLRRAAGALQAREA